MQLGVPHETFEQRVQENAKGLPLPRNGILYRLHANHQQRLFVSETELDRMLSQIVRAGRCTRTVAFPSTTREALSGAFEGTALESVILNEGLERLGRCSNSVLVPSEGVFSGTRIRHVVLPSTLRVLGDYAFQNCKRLGSVAFRQEAATTEEDRRLEIGYRDMVLPATLEEIGSHLFGGCPGFDTIWVHGRSAIGDLRRLDDSAAILPAGTTVGGMPLVGLRRLKEVVVPEGVEDVGEQWFKNTGLESVSLPASVRVVAREAFYNCRSLKRVVFARNGNLEEIGDKCFQNSGIEEITLPDSLR